MPGNDTYTKVLQHFEGADGATSFPDVNVGGSAKTWTVNGTAALQTAQKPWGGSSVYFGGGTTGWLDTPRVADFDVGTEPFTLDFWFLVGGGSGTRTVFGTSNSAFSATAFDMYINAANKMILNCQDTAGASYPISSVSAFPTAGAVWTHAEACRDGPNTLRMFINGIQEATITTLSGKALKAAPNKVSIGRLGEYSGLGWFGWIKEFRFSKGIARHTSNFTPQMTEYTADPKSAGFNMPMMGL